MASILEGVTIQSGDEVSRSKENSMMAHTVENMNNEMKRHQQVLEDIGDESSVTLREIEDCKQSILKRQLNIRVFRAKHWRNVRNSGQELVGLIEDQTYFRKMMQYAEAVETVVFEVNKKKKLIRKNPVPTAWKSLELLEQVLDEKRFMLKLSEDVVDLQNQIKTYQKTISELEVELYSSRSEGNQESLVSNLQRSKLKLRDLTGEFSLLVDLIEVKEKFDASKKDISSLEVMLNSMKQKARDSKSKNEKDYSYCLSKIDQADEKLCIAKTKMYLLESLYLLLHRMGLSTKRVRMLSLRVDTLEEMLNHQKGLARNEKDKCSKENGVTRVNEIIEDIKSAMESIVELENKYVEDKSELDLLCRKESIKLEGLGLNLYTYKGLKIEKLDYLKEASKQQDIQLKAKNSSCRILMGVVEDRLKAHVSQVTELENALNEVKSLNRTAAYIEAQKEIQLERCGEQLLQAKINLDLFEDRYDSLSKLENVRIQREELTKRICELEQDLNEQKDNVRKCENESLKNEKESEMTTMLRSLSQIHASLLEADEKYDVLKDAVHEKNRLYHRGFKNIAAIGSSPIVAFSDESEFTGLEILLRGNYNTLVPTLRNIEQHTSWADRMRFAKAQLATSNKEIQHHVDQVAIVERYVNDAKEKKRRQPNSSNAELSKLESFLLSAKSKLSFLEKYKSAWIGLISCMKQLESTEAEVSLLEEQLNGQKVILHELKLQKFGNVEEIKAISDDLDAACKRLQDLDSKYSSLLDILVSYEQACEKSIGWPLTRQLHMSKL